MPKSSLLLKFIITGALCYAIDFYVRTHLISTTDGIYNCRVQGPRISPVNSCTHTKYDISSQSAMRCDHVRFRVGAEVTNCVIAAHSYRHPMVNDPATLDLLYIDDRDFNQGYFLTETEARKEANRIFPIGKTVSVYLRRSADTFELSIPHGYMYSTNPLFDRWGVAAIRIALCALIAYISYDLIVYVLFHVTTRIALFWITVWFTDVKWR